MADDDKRSGNNPPAEHPYGHLIPGPDPRAPVQRAADECREKRRRRGGNRNWWKVSAPPNSEGN